VTEAPPLGELRLTKAYKRHPVGTPVVIVGALNVRGKPFYLDLRLAHGKVLKTVPIEHITG